MFLKVKDLKVNYGYVEAIKGISLKVNKSELVIVIGANGAGKSTLLETIVGLHKARVGEILFENMSIFNKSAKVINNLGISLVPQGRGLFVDQTVEDNLLMGAYVLCRGKKGRRETKKNLDWIYDSFPILKLRTRQLAGSMSGGEQQILSIARSLMARPRLLLLDEPSLGLAPMMIDKVLNIIKQQNEKGLTVVLVEQGIQGLQIADRGYVLETGKIVLEGTSKQLLNDPKFMDTYFGTAPLQASSNLRSP